MRRMSELAPSTSASRVDSFTCRPSLWQICSMRLEICCLVGFLHAASISVCAGSVVNESRDCKLLTQGLCQARCQGLLQVCFMVLMRTQFLIVVLRAARVVSRVCLSFVRACYPRPLAGTDLGLTHRLGQCDASLKAHCISLAHQKLIEHDCLATVYLLHAKANYRHELLRHTARPAPQSLQLTRF